jgi:hypothetical protein
MSDQMEDLARVAKIFKAGKDFYTRLEFSNTYSNSKITIEEASKLEVGQQIKIIWWWKELDY